MSFLSLIISALSLAVALLFYAATINDSADHKPAFVASDGEFVPAIRKRANSHPQANATQSGFSQPSNESSRRRRRVCSEGLLKVREQAFAEVQKQVQKQAQTQPNVAGKAQSIALNGVQYDGLEEVPQATLGRRPPEDAKAENALLKRRETKKTSSYSLIAPTRDYNLLSEQVVSLLDARRRVERSQSQVVKEKLQAQTRKDLADVNTSLWSLRTLLSDTRSGASTYHKAGVLPLVIEQLRGSQHMWTAAPETCQETD